MKKLNFNALSITHKLVLGLCFFLIFVAIFSVLLLSLYRAFENSFLEIEEQTANNAEVLSMIDYKNGISDLMESYFFTEDPDLVDTYEIAYKELDNIYVNLIEDESSILIEDDPLLVYEEEIAQLKQHEERLFELILQGERELVSHLFYGDYLEQEKAVDLLLETHLTIQQNTLRTMFYDNKRVILGFQITLAFFLVMIPIFLVVYTFLFTSFVAAKLKDMATQARAIASGDFSKRVKVETNDEVGELASAFNQMADELSRSYSQLEEKVKEKTKALSSKVIEVEEQNKTLVSTKSAMLNILEDLENTKANMEEEKAKDETILANIADGILYLNEKEQITLINNQAQKMLETNVKGALGVEWHEKVKVVNESGVLLPFEKHPMHKALMSKRTVETSEYYIKRGEDMIPVSITITPITLKGTLMGVLFVIRDISKDKEIQRMKTEFISLASHQLRTPLTAMKWFSEMLLAGDAGVLNDEQKEYLSNISASNERMIELVEALLKISRLESGRITIEPKDSEVASLLEEVLVEIRPRAEQKKIKMSVDVQEGLPHIMMDQKLIRQVFSNLLTNSVKYTNMGGEVLVRIVDDGDDILCEVTDNGVGIPREEQALVFNKFYRGKNIQLIDTDGTGLGLYLVRLVVQSSGGKIWYESVETKGTSFWFTIPKKGVAAKKGEVSLTD